MTPRIRSALVIDDDKDVCFLLKKTLTHYNLHVATAHSILQGRDCLHEVKPQLIFLDNSLPDGRGIDFVAEIRSFDPSIKIIMITGDPDLGLEQIALEKGVYSFIPKPFKLTSISSEMNSLT